MNNNKKKLKEKSLAIKIIIKSTKDSNSLLPIYKLFSNLNFVTVLQ